MIACTDGTGHEVILEAPAKRIVSLVPSQTEWLAYLGLDHEVLGITKFCVHPGSWRKRKMIVGGTKSVHYDRIQALNPDLIIGNKEENTQDMILELRRYYPCYTSDIRTFQSACTMMMDIGSLTARSEAADSFVNHCRFLSETLRIDPVRQPKRRVAYVIWMDPLMVVGSGTYIDHMINAMGWENAFGDKERYPQISEEKWRSVSPEVVMLSSEPFPFRKVHVDFFRRLSPGAEVRLVDGELFSWYGWRMAKALTILTEFKRNLLSI